MESSSSSYSQLYSQGEHVDIIYENKVYNGEVVKCDQKANLMKIHETGMHEMYDKVVNFNSLNIQKQWKSGMEFRTMNRLDIFDLKFQKWREAHIIEIKSNNSNKAIKIHYKGYGSIYDEWIDIPREAIRIKEVGLLSGAEGAAKHSLRMQQENKENQSQIQSALNQCQPQRNVQSGGGSWGVQFHPKQQRQFDYQAIDWRSEETKFQRELAKKNLLIVEVGTDGNCMFRAIAHQAYGDEDLHRMIREKVMDYILHEKEYFKDFIEGGNVEDYVARKKLNGSWGDDVEIQALSEIYNRPIEIYAYSNQPMRTFHELVGSKDPFRLSYHGKSHYNSIVTKDWTYEKCFINEQPGQFEEAAIQESIERNQNTGSEQSTNDSNLVIQQEPEEVKKTREAAQMILRSREEFQIQAQQDMQNALKQSMMDVYAKPTTALYKQLENQNIQLAIQESQQQMNEEDMIKLAMKESMEENKNNLANINLEDAFMKTVMAMSENGGGEMSIGIQFALENGFSIEQAVEAQSVVGDDPELMLSYLFDKVISK